MVCSALHSNKTVVSQVGALRTGLQACRDDCKGKCLSACLPPSHPQQPLAQLTTKGGWHKHLAKPEKVYRPL